MSTTPTTSDGGVTSDMLRVACGISHPDPDVERRIEAMRKEAGHETGPYGGCGAVMFWTFAYRCVECGRWFHRPCAGRHFGDCDGRPDESGDLLESA